MATPSLTQISQALSDLLPKLKPAGAVPTGCIAHFHTVPDGWLLCNGAAVSRTKYANLFAVIGTKYGAGNGSTTFNVPNLAGRFLESTTNASEVGHMKAAGLPNITGSVNSNYAVFVETNEAFGMDYGRNDRYTSVESRSFYAPRGFSLNAARLSAIYGASAVVQTASALLMPCIKF